MANIQSAFYFPWIYKNRSKSTSQKLFSLDFALNLHKCIEELIKNPLHVAEQDGVEVNKAWKSFYEAKLITENPTW